MIIFKNLENLNFENKISNKQKFNKISKKIVENSNQNWKNLKETKFFNIILKKISNKQKMLRKSQINLKLKISFKLIKFKNDWN